jgi:hypothetical protein
VPSPSRFPSTCWGKALHPSLSPNHPPTHICTHTHTYTFTNTRAHTYPHMWCFMRAPTPLSTNTTSHTHVHTQTHTHTLTCGVTWGLPTLQSTKRFSTPLENWSKQDSWPFVRADTHTPNATALLVNKQSLMRTRTEEASE